MYKIPILNKDIVIKCVEVFDSNWQFSDTDKAIGQIVKTYPHNTRYD